MGLLCRGISRQSRRMLRSTLRGQASPLRLASLRIPLSRTAHPITVVPRARSLNVTPFKSFHSSPRWDRRTTYTRFGGNRSPYMGSHLFTRYLSERNLLMVVGVVSGFSGADVPSQRACELETQCRSSDLLCLSSRKGT